MFACLRFFIFSENFYEELRKLYFLLNSSKPKSDLSEFKLIWNRVKPSDHAKESYKLNPANKKDPFREVKLLIENYKDQLEERKKKQKQNLLGFFAKTEAVINKEEIDHGSFSAHENSFSSFDECSSSSLMQLNENKNSSSNSLESSLCIDDDSQEPSTSFADTEDDLSNMSSISNISSNSNLETDSTSEPRSAVLTPVQTKLKEDIDVIKNEIVKMSQPKNKKDADLLCAKHDALQKLESKLKKLKDHGLSQAKYRKKITGVKILRPVGRPRLEEKYPALLKSIENIAMQHSSADDRRRTESLVTLQSISKYYVLVYTNLLQIYAFLASLQKELELQGYEISVSALHTRFLPTKKNSIQARRHINPLNMKVLLPQNDEHNHHIDSKFCFSSIEHAKERASYCGSNEVLWESVDDKAKVIFNTLKYFLIILITIFYLILDLSWNSSS